MMIVFRTGLYLSSRDNKARKLSRDVSFCGFYWKKVRKSVHLDCSRRPFLSRYRGNRHFSTTKNYTEAEAHTECHNKLKAVKKKTSEKLGHELVA